MGRSGKMREEVGTSGKRWEEVGKSGSAYRLLSMNRLFLHKGYSLRTG